MSATRDLDARTKIAIEHSGHEPGQIADFMEKVSKVVGLLPNWNVIPEGEESLTIFADDGSQTGGGQPVVVKIFPYGTPADEVSEYIVRWDLLKTGGVNVPSRITGLQGNHAIKVDNGVYCEANKQAPITAAIYRSLGDLFRDQIKTSALIRSGVRQIAQIHSINTTGIQNEDSWGVSALMGNVCRARELFEGTSHISAAHRVCEETWDQIATFVDEELIHFPEDRLTPALTHKNPSASNLTVDAAGQVGIHDFGTVGTGARIVDLAEYLATAVMTMPIDYALPSAKARKTPLPAFGIIVDEYMKVEDQVYGTTTRLTETEMLAIPVYVQASFASYWINGALASRENPKRASTNAYARYTHDGFYGFQAMQYWREPMQEHGHAILDRFNRGIDL